MSLHVKGNNGIKIYLDFSVFCSMVLHQLQGDSSSSGSAEVLIFSPESDYAGLYPGEVEPSSVMLSNSSFLLKTISVTP
jgi:hypothetical protein